MSASEDRERARAWVARQRAHHAHFVAAQEAIEQALIALRASSADERDARIVHALRTQLEAELTEPECDSFDPAAWERAISSGAITPHEARAIMPRVHDREARDWLADEGPQRCWSRPEEGEEPRDLLEGGGARVLMLLPSLRETEGVDEAVRWISRCETWGDALRDGIVRWCVALLRGDFQALLEADDALHAVSDQRWCDPTEEDGPEFDRRALIAERLLDAGEMPLARRWLERMWRAPVRFAVGPNDLAKGPPIALGRTIRRTVTPEQLAELEQRAFDVLSEKESTTFEWLDFASWASPTFAAASVERAVQRVERTAALIDASALDLAMQHRVSIAMADRASEWIEMVNSDASDARVMGGTTLSARLRAIPLVDEACAKRAWPAIAQLVDRGGYGTDLGDRGAIVEAVVACADRGVPEASALLARWRATGERGWSTYFGELNKRPASELASVLLLRLPFDERRAWIEQFERVAGLSFATKVHTAGLPLDASGVRWLIAQPRRVIDNWLCDDSVRQKISGDDLWRVLDAWATPRLDITRADPLRFDGPTEELCEWLRTERTWTRSRWSWSREALLDWIERGEPSRERHWLFEPGVTAMVHRLRSDERGRAALDALALQLAGRSPIGPTMTSREQDAIEALLPYASRATLLALDKSVVSRDPSGRIAQAVAQQAMRFGNELALQIGERLGLDLVAIAPTERRAYEYRAPPTFEARWVAWLERQEIPRSVPWWITEGVSTETARGLVEWAFARAGAGQRASVG